MHLGLVLSHTIFNAKSFENDTFHLCVRCNKQPLNVMRMKYTGILKQSKRQWDTLQSDIADYWTGMHNTKFW